jgi:tRNA pseudouridine13 synthase
MRQGEVTGGRAHLGPKELAGRNWRIERLGWTDRPFAGQAIAANRFKIEVFDLSRRDCRDMDGAADLLAVHTGAHRPAPGAAPSRLRVVNYFGSQRFGSARAGGGFPARRLVEGDYEGALRLILTGIARADAPQDKAHKRLVGGQWGQWGKVLGRLGGWPYRPAIAVLAGGGDFTGAFAALPYFTQQMNVEAYQSYLWNLTAAELLARTCPPDRLWERPDPLGLMTLRFVCADSAPAELANLDLPLLAPSTEPQEPWAGAVEDVLGREGLTLAKLRLPGLRRPFFGPSAAR